jgi:phosphatidylserine decarboxylase
MNESHSLTQFTANRRDISIINSTTLVPGKTVPIGLVAVGAMLVGAIEWTRDPETSSEPVTFKKGDDLGCFKYGGSTVIAIFPEEANILWDSDLVASSEKKLETVVKVGEHIGKVGAASS